MGEDGVLGSAFCIFLYVDVMYCKVRKITKFSSDLMYIAMRVLEHDYNFVGKNVICTRIDFSIIRFFLIKGNDCSAR